MNHFEKNIFRVISNYATKENQKLKIEFGKGIFDMPELAFVYEVGKRLSQNQVECFGSDKLNWLREVDYGNGGPTDLSFIPEKELERSFAFEFKMDNTVYSYKKDIEKLHDLGTYTESRGPWTKYFCALKWVLSKEQAHEFLDSMLFEFGTSALYLESAIIPCVVGNRSISQYCLLSFWRIRQTPPLVNSVSSATEHALLPLNNYGLERDDSEFWKYNYCYVHLDKKMLNELKKIAESSRNIEDHKEKQFFELKEPVVLLTEDAVFHPKHDGIKGFDNLKLDVIGFITNRPSFSELDTKLAKAYMLCTSSSFTLIAENRDDGVQYPRILYRSPATDFTRIQELLFSI